MNILARVFRRTPSLQSRVAFATGIAAAIVVGIVGTIVWIGIVSAASFFVAKLVFGLRVSEDAEREGLDITSHGETAYEA